MSLSPVSLRVSIAGGAVLMGTLYLTLPRRNTTDDLNYTKDFAFMFTGCYIMTLPVAFLLIAGTTTPIPDMLATHAGIMGLTAPLQLAPYSFLDLTSSLFSKRRK